MLWLGGVVWWLFVMGEAYEEEYDVCLCGGVHWE
jgi:hypothetical protein